MAHDTNNGGLSQTDNATGIFFAILAVGLAVGSSACTSPGHTSQTRTAAPVVAERPVVPPIASERPMPPDRVAPSTAAAGGSTAVTTVCATHLDARGNLVYDDPLCPTRDRQAIDATHDAQDPTYYDRNINSAVVHVRKAEVAGDQGNIPEMLRHTELALSQATAAQRAVDDASLNDGIMDLRETMILGNRNQIAPAALRDARVKLTQASQAHPVGARTAGVPGARTLTGELKRTTTPMRADGGEYFVVRDRQRGDTPVVLSPDMSRQVREGDIVEMQLDSQGRVLAISKYP